MCDETCLGEELLVTESTEAWEGARFVSRRVEVGVEIALAMEGQVAFRTVPKENEVRLSIVLVQPEFVLEELMSPVSVHWYVT